MGESENQNPSSMAGIENPDLQLVPRDEPDDEEIYGGSITSGILV